MEIKIGTVISRALGRAADSTGTLTGLVTISAFGLAKLMGTIATATAFTFAVFGAVGALECIHRQRKSEAIKRRNLPHSANNEFIMKIVDKYPRYHFKEFKELSHGGFQWKIIGLEEIPFPITVAGPFCPTCGNKLTERLEVRFPCRTRITLFCSCGFSQESRYFSTELAREVHELANTPS